jgi:hypothetical protein
LLIKHFFSSTIILAFLLWSRVLCGTLSVIAVGDIMMGSDYPAPNLPPDNGRAIYAQVKHILQDADLTLGNLEGTLLTGGVCAKKIEKGRCYAFRTPPEFAHRLIDAGFDYVNLANNHMNDFGTNGIAATIKSCEDVDLACGGPYGATAEFDIRGVKVVIVSFSTSPNSNTIFKIEEAQRIIAEHSRTHDITIVSFHGGGEGLKFLHTKDISEVFMGWPRGNVVAFAHAVIDSGADFVWGHGPHVPRALEVYKDRLIAYSLGNFCTWGFNLGDERGYAPILEVELDSAGVFCGGQIHSAVQGTYKYLELDTLHRAAGLMKALSEEDFTDTAPLVSKNGHIFSLPRLSPLNRQ